MAASNRSLARRPRNELCGAELRCASKGAADRRLQQIGDLQGVGPPSRSLCELARRRGCLVAGVRRAGRLDEQKMNLFACHRAMLNTFGYDVEFARTERHRAIPQFDV